MKWLAFIAAILFVCACPSIAKDHANMQQVLDSAHKPADLFQGDGNPFDLEIDFIAQFKGPVPGHFSMKWQSKDHWRSQVEFGGFEQTSIKNGEMEYTLKNFNYTPDEVLKLFGLLHFGSEPTKINALKEKDRSENGVSLACIQAAQFRYGWTTHDLCIDTASRDLLNDEWEDQPAGNKVVKEREQFAEYVDLDGKRYPKKLVHFHDGAETVSANVIALRPAAFDAGLFDPPKGAIERRMCPAIVPPKAIKEIQPEFSKSGRPAGKVTLSLTILTDGSVGGIDIIYSGGQKVDQIAIDTMKKWKYKPAMCGDEPVVSDVEVSFTFMEN
jgi:TonB family protein